MVLLTHPSAALGVHLHLSFSLLAGGAQDVALSSGLGVDIVCSDQLTALSTTPK